VRPRLDAFALRRLWVRFHERLGPRLQRHSPAESAQGIDRERLAFFRKCPTRIGAGMCGQPSSAALGSRAIQIWA
jgi:hypothetical protein